MSPHGPMTGWSQGICPVCRRRLAVNPAGVMRAHPERQPEKCGGSGRPPAVDNDSVRRRPPAPTEVERLKSEVARLMEGQRDTNELARQLADVRDERDAALKEAAAATSAKHQAENDLSSRIVTLELQIEDVLVIHREVDKGRPAWCAGCGGTWPCPTARAAGVAR